MTSLNFNPEDLDLIPMLHTYKCGAFTCGDTLMDQAFVNELPQAVQEGRSRAYYLDYYGKCIGFFSLKAERLELDVIDIEQRKMEGPIRVFPGIMLEMLAVDINYQKQGIGQRLVDEALAISAEVAERVGARFLVADSTSVAIKLYEANGFLPTMTQSHTTTTRMIVEII